MPKARCSNCGRRWSAMACGMNHAIVAAERRRDRAAVWAIVTTRDHLAVLDGRCPIYWTKRAAVMEWRRRCHASTQYRVVKTDVSFREGAE